MIPSTIGNVLAELFNKRCTDMTDEELEFVSKGLDEACLLLDNISHVASSVGLEIGEKNDDDPNGWLTIDSSVCTTMLAIAQSIEVATSMCRIAHEACQLRYRKDFEKYRNKGGKKVAA